MARCYVKAFFDWIEQTAALSDAERGRLFIAILEYARSGLDPKLDGREGILFPVFQSQIDRDKEISNIRATSGSVGGSSKPEGKQKQAKVSKIKQTQANFPNKEEEKDKDKDKDKEKENTSMGRSPRFAPPTVEEVAAYCQERGNQVDPQRFVDYYDANGWKVGRNPMKDWKAAVRTWEKNGYDTRKPSGNVFYDIAMEGVPYDE